MSINFKGLEQNAGYGGYSLSDQMLTNLRFWISQNLLMAGAYSIYRRGQDSFFANDESNLRNVSDTRFPDRAVYEGVGREWVFESGVSIPEDIFRVSGIYIDGNFVAVDDTGPSRHHVDYLHGRILFDQSQNPTSIISANYVSRAIFVGFADSRTFQSLLLESVEEFLSVAGVPSGTASRDEQIWLPSVFIEEQNTKARGLQLGGGQIQEKTIVLHIFADTPRDRNFLLNTLSFQNRSAFWMGDLNSIPPLFDEFGDVLPGTTNFIDLINTYPYRKLRIMDGTCKVINSLNTKLFRGQVRWNIEVDLGGI